MVKIIAIVLILLGVALAVYALLTLQQLDEQQRSVEGKVQSWLQKLAGGGPQQNQRLYQGMAALGAVLALFGIVLVLRGGRK